MLDGLYSAAERSMGLLDDARIAASDRLGGAAESLRQSLDVPDDDKTLSRRFYEGAGRYVAEQGSNLVEANRLGWQRFGSDVTGGLIPRLSDDELERSRTISKDVIENNPLSPLPFAQTPELRGLAPFQEEALRRVGAASKAAEPAVTNALDLLGLGKAADAPRTADVPPATPRVPERTPNVPTVEPRPDASWMQPETATASVPAPSRTMPATDDDAVTKAVRALGLDAPTSRAMDEAVSGSTAASIQPQGFVPGSSSADTALPNIARSAAVQGTAGAVEASQEEGATPESILQRAGERALLGAANRGVRSTLPGLHQANARAILNAVPSTVGDPDVETHVRGFGVFTGVSDAARVPLERLAKAGRQFADPVPMNEMGNVAKSLGMNPNEVAADWVKRDTRQAAAEVEVIRRGIAGQLGGIQERMSAIRAGGKLTDTEALLLFDDLVDVAVGAEFLRGGARAGESAGRALGQFRNRIDATQARALLDGFAQTRKSIDDVGDLLRTVRDGGAISGKGQARLAGLADLLDQQAGTMADGGRFDMINGRIRERWADPTASETVSGRMADDQMAREVRLREQIKREIDQKIQGIWDREKRQAIRDAVQDQTRMARDLMERIVKDTNNPALREDFDILMRQMADHSNLGDIAQQRLRGMLDTRLDDWAAQHMRGVERRIGQADTAAERAWDVAMIRSLAQRVREVAAQVQKGNVQPEALTVIDDLLIDLNSLGAAGQQKAYDLGQSLKRAGIIRFAEKQVDDDQIDAFMALMRSIDPDDPAQLGRVIRMLRTGSFTGGVIEYAITNMLSGPPTQMVNIGSSLGQGVALFGFKMPAMVAIDAVTGNKAGLSKAELSAAYQGIADAFGVGLKAAGEIMQQGYSTMDVERATHLMDFGGIRGEQLTQRFGWPGAVLHSISTRPLAAADTLFRHMIYSGQLHALAERRARQLGSTREAVLADIVNHLDIMDKAGEVADYTLLRAPSSVSSMLGMARRKGGAPAEMAIHMVVPFVTTPWNWLKQGVEFSPVGTVVNVGRLVTEKDPLRRVELASHIAAGASLTGLAAWMVASGNLSGDGPSDSSERRMLMAEGWRPRSIRVNGAWVSYDNTPVTIPFSAVATGFEHWQEAVKKGEARGESMDEAWRYIISGGFFGSTSAIANQSFVKNAAEMYEGVREKNLKTENVAANLLSRYIPASSAIAWLSRIGDSYLRETRDVEHPFTATLQERTPWRGQLPARVDVLGRPLDQTQRLAAVGPAVSPQRESAIFSELQRLDLRMPQVGATIAGEPLTKDQARQYRERAQQYRGAVLDQLLQSSLYRTADDTGKARLIRNATTRAAAWASQEILPGANDSGQEFLSVARGDLGTATTGYLRALEAQAAIAALATDRYQGYRGKAAETLAQDRAVLSRLREGLGESQGDAAFLARYGQARYVRARTARVNPRYRQQVERIERATPELIQYLRPATQRTLTEQAS